MRFATGVSLVAVALAAAGCNAILGAEEHDLAPPAAGGSGGSSGASGGGQGGAVDAGGAGGGFDSSAGGSVGGAGGLDSSAGAGGIDASAGTGGGGTGGASGGGTGGTDAAAGTGGTGGQSGTGGTGGGTGGTGGGTGGTGGGKDSGTDAADGGANEFVPTATKSCAGGLTCNGQSCCTSIVVHGGTFPQGRGEAPDASDYFSGGSDDELPEFSSTVSTFALDKYEVTVGRFRKFLDAYESDAGVPWHPQSGDGVNPNIPGSGWQSPAWDGLLPDSLATFKGNLKCSDPDAGPNYATWTDSAGPNEDKPINCLTWDQAFAFCIWDGGRLPTESEWEYASAGGSENRRWPWGAVAPDCSRANATIAGLPTPCGPGNTKAIAPVGSYPAGNARWGHMDIAGNVEEWTLDWLDYYPTFDAGGVTNFAKLPSPISELCSLRGGSFFWGREYLRAVSRSGWYAGFYPQDEYGVRCARAAP